MTTLSTTDVNNGDTTDANVLNSNFTATRVVVNGNLDNDNINASADIVVSKLAGGTEGHYLQTVGGQPTWAAGPAGGTGVPCGAVTEFAGSVAPTGYLFCDGSAVSRVTYVELFDCIGTSYGSGDGSTTFNVPDTRGRMPIGKGTHSEVNALGDSDGESTVGNRRAKHKHTSALTDPGHTHTVISEGAGSVINTLDKSSQAQGTQITSSSTTGITLTVGMQTNTTTDSPGFLVFNYIIKT